MVEYIEMMTSYSLLEREIQGCMRALCSAVCAQCVTPCCRIDFCRESMQSPFLASVRTRFVPDACWDPAVGWLTARGCSLSAGRPPVCYEFLCQSLLTNQPTRLHREALQMLSRLLTTAGTCARGRRHLVELNDLSRLNVRRLTLQLDRARSTLMLLRRFWEQPDAGVCQNEPPGGQPWQAVA